MRRVLAFGIALACAGTVWAAPNVAQNTQKGTLLVFPDIDVRQNVTTIVRIQNDATQAVWLHCYFMDKDKQRNDFAMLITRGQAIWFDAATGAGTIGSNPFPTGFGAGMLACLAEGGGGIDTNGTRIRWNHLSGTATVVDYDNGTAYEYSAWAFAAINPNLQPNPVPTLPAPCGNEPIFTQTFDAYPFMGPLESTGGVFALNSTGYTRPNSSNAMGHPHSYLGNAYDYYQITGLDLRGVANAKLTFDFKASLEARYDAFNIIASWGALAPGMMPVRPTAASAMQYSYTYGLGGMWPEGYDGTLNATQGVAEFDLSAYSNGIVNIRFQFASDLTGNFDGINIDNIRISGERANCTPQTDTFDDFLMLDGLMFDICPATLIGQFSPEGAVLEAATGPVEFGQTRAVFVGCNMDLRQAAQRYDTKLTFDVWNENELKLTGAHDCADGWHETYLTDMVAEGDNFTLAGLRSLVGRYRVTPTKDDAACRRATAKVGILGVQVTDVTLAGGFSKVATNLTAVGTYKGFIAYSSGGPVDEGTIR